MSKAQYNQISRPFFACHNGAAIFFPLFCHFCGLKVLNHSSIFFCLKIFEHEYQTKKTKKKNYIFIALKRLKLQKIDPFNSYNGTIFLVLELNT